MFSDLINFWNYRKIRLKLIPIQSFKNKNRLVVIKFCL